MKQEEVMEQVREKLSLLDLYLTYDDHLSVKDIDRILSISEILIKDPTQGVPDISVTAMAMFFDEPRLLCKSIQQAMKEENWVKVLKEKK